MYKIIFVFVIMLGFVPGQVSKESFRVYTVQDKLNKMQREVKDQLKTYQQIEADIKDFERRLDELKCKFGCEDV